MSDLAIVDGFFATADRFVWHPATRTAVLSDLHLGIEITMRRQGISFPAVNVEQVQRGWAAMAKRFVANGRVVIAGDLFDSATPDAESIHVARELVEALPEGVAVTVLPGNHDPGIEEMRRIFEGTRVGVNAAALVGIGGECAVIHGDRWAALDGVEFGNKMIVGHQHPAVVLKDRMQSAKMICFARWPLVMRAGQVEVMILPTFSRAPLGTNLMTEGRWILDCPKPWPGMMRIAGIVEGKGGEEGGGQVLDFGPLEGLVCRG